MFYPQAAFVRQIEVMSEETKRIFEGSRVRHRQMPWRGLAGTQNKMMHAYDVIDQRRLTAVPRSCYKKEKERSGAMSKTAVIRARVEPELKEQAETIFERLGVSTTQAIGMFYKQVILRRGLPFDVAIPNATTRRTFEAADAGRDVVLCRDADDMFKKLGRSKRNDSRGLEEHPSQGTRTPRKAPRHEEGLKCEG